MTTFESFRRIPDFPDYMIGSMGNVYNSEFNRWMTLSPTEGGDLTVGLMRDGTQYRRSVKVLVARAFVPGEDHVFDTPIQLDNDKENLRADNIRWRPRWFAWRYFRQFADPPPISFTGPVLDTTTGIEYEDVLHAAMGTGTLVADIRQSLLHRKPVFPTKSVFEYRY